MIKKFYFLSFLVLMLMGSSCGEKVTTPAQPEQNKDIVKFSILYTSDEHGWLEGSSEYGGAASLYAEWQKLGIDLDSNAIILSGGDMWTGPAISTTYKGKPMVEIMNKMGYDAVAVGNHDFDFSYTTLFDNISVSNFRYTGANIKYSYQPGKIKPYHIFNIRGIKVAVIGLANTEVPNLSFAENIKGFQFANYADAISESVNKAKSEGANLFVVISHICSNEMKPLIPLLKDLNVSAIMGGHCHDLTNQETDNVLMIEAGSGMRNYAKIDFQYDRASKKLTSKTAILLDNKGTDKASHIKSIVDFWRKKTDSTYSEILGFASTEIKKSSNELNNLILDSWLDYFPDADIAMTNDGGIRQSIPAGNISIETILGLLPFENYLLRLKLTGTQVKDCISYFELGGLNLKDGYKLRDGSVLDDNKVYTILTIDFLYYQSNSKFARYDSKPYISSLNYRDPLINLLRKLKTNVSNPLNNYLDPNPRR